MRFSCEARSRHGALGVGGLGLLGVGLFAAQWGLRQATGIDGSAVATGGVMFVLGSAALALRGYLRSRPEKHWNEVDGHAGQVRLFLGGAAHSQRPVRDCRNIRVQEVFKIRPRDGSTWVWYEVWVGSFRRPLFCSWSSRDEATQWANSFADAVGGEPPEFGDRAAEEKWRREQLSWLGAASSEELVEYLDPRCSPFDTASDTAAAVTLAAIARLRAESLQVPAERVAPLLACGDKKVEAAASGLA